MTSSRTTSSRSASVFGSGAVGAQIVADPVAQRAGLADVNRVPVRVEVQIHSRLLGQPGNLFLEFVDGHTLLCRVFSRCLNPPLYVTLAQYPEHRGLSGTNERTKRRASGAHRPAEASFDLYRRDRGDLHVPAARDHQFVCRAADPPEHADADRRHRQRGRGVGARLRALHPGRRHHDRRQHLRLHRRQGRVSAAAAVAVRRLLGFDARSLLRPGAADRLDLPVLEAGAQRLRDDRGAGAHLLDHDELRARARRVARREVQGGLHGAPRAHRAVHDRRVHEPHGGRPVGDPGAVDPRGGESDLLHVSGAERAADAVEGRPTRLVQPRLLLDRRARHAPLRSLGDRDPRLRVAHAARLARRPDGHRPGAPRVGHG